jgi:hypothetical protein
MEKVQGGVSQEVLERLQSIIRTLQNEKDSLEKRLAKAMREKFEKPSKLLTDSMIDEDSPRENFIYMKEAGVVFSSASLGSRLRQPASTRPVPFSKVYVCDFELDFISKDDTEVLLKPIQDLKSKNEELRADNYTLADLLEKVQ